MAPAAPIRRAGAAAMMAIASVAFPAPPAVAATTTPPRVLCVPNVGAATLDETLPLAGRVRALGDAKGRITGRSLSCPYSRDGRLALEVEAVWVTRAGGSATVGPVGCGTADYIVDPDGGSATLAAARRQVELTVEGDTGLVRAGERAARLIASYAAETAITCDGAARDVVATSSGGSGGMMVGTVLSVALLLGAVVLLLRRRSGTVPSLRPAEAPADTAAISRRPSTDTIEGLVGRGPVGSGAGLPARLLALTALSAQRVGDDGSPGYRTDRLRRAAAAVIATPPARWRSPAVIDRDHPALTPDRRGERVRS